MPVCSDRLVNAFAEAGVDNFQTYKAILRNPDTGDVWDSYQVVSILGKVSFADLEKSTDTEFLGDR